MTAPKPYPYVNPNLAQPPCLVDTPLLLLRLYLPLLRGFFFCCDAFLTHGCFDRPCGDAFLCSLGFADTSPPVKLHHTSGIALETPDSLWINNGSYIPTLLRLLEDITATPRQTSRQCRETTMATAKLSILLAFLTSNIQAD